METNNKNIQILQYLQKRATCMGFIPNQRLNRRIIGHLVFYYFTVFLNVMYLLYEANTFLEYTNSMFICLTSSVGLLLFIITIYQAWRIFEVIDFLQQFIGDSK